MFSALASGARGPGFNPRDRWGKISVSEHTFLSVIFRDNTKQVHRPSDRDINWRPPVQGESPPLQVKEPYNSLHDYSCKTGVYNVQLLIILERGCSSMDRKKEKPFRGFPRGGVPFPLFSWNKLHHNLFMSLVTRKPVFEVFDQIRLKLACSATETSKSLEILYLVSIEIILSRQQTIKALIRLHGCGGWSAPLLFAYGINRFSHDVLLII